MSEESVSPNAWTFSGQPPGVNVENFAIPPGWLKPVLVIMSSMIMLCGVTAISFGAYMVREGSLMTASTSGQAIQVVLYESHGRNPSTDCEIHYRYLVDGIEYTGYTPDANAYLDECNGNLQGQPITVYYVPDNPGQSSLNSASRQQFDGYILCALGLLVIGTGVFMSVYLLAWYRKRRSAPSSSSSPSLARALR